MPHDGHLGRGADINRSEGDFTPVVETDDAGEQRLSIIFGLSAVRNVGEGLVAHIVAEREANGPYADFYDFCQRVDTQVLNKRTVESLIKAGASTTSATCARACSPCSSRSSTTRSPAAGATWAS